MENLKEIIQAIIKEKEKEMVEFKDDFNLDWQSGYLTACRVILALMIEEKDK